VTQVPEARFPVAVIQGVPVVAAPEEIDLTNAGGLRAALREAGGYRCARIVVDLTRTRFCDSAGVQALAVAHRRAREEGRQLLLAASGAAVLRVLELTGIDRVIVSFASLEEALGRASAVDGSKPPGS
jgi:anti-sigma B factor antagonist